MMERGNDTPYQPLRESGGGTGEWAGLVSSEKTLNSSSSGSTSSQQVISSLEESPAPLVDHAEQPSHFDLSSESANGGIGSKTTSTSTGAGPKRTVSFWVSVAMVFRLSYDMIRGGSIGGRVLCGYCKCR